MVSEVQICPESEDGFDLVDIRGFPNLAKEPSMRRFIAIAMKKCMQYGDALPERMSVVRAVDLGEIDRWGYDLQITICYRCGVASSFGYGEHSYSSWGVNSETGEALCYGD